MEEGTRLDRSRSTGGRRRRTSEKAVLTSLLLVEEKLLESEYFLGRIAISNDPIHLRYDLNAFVSACRVAFFLLRKELARVDGFRDWVKEAERRIDEDDVQAFFVRLRNFSQKEGRIQVHGQMSSRADGRPSAWRWIFVDGSLEVPTVLKGVQVATACRMYLARTATLILECARRFPYDACPWMALSREGVRERQLDLNRIEFVLGIPKEFIRAAAGNDDEQRRIILQRHVDPVAYREIERLSQIERN